MNIAIGQDIGYISTTGAYKLYFLCVGITKLTVWFGWRGIKLSLVELESYYGLVFVSQDCLSNIQYYAAGLKYEEQLTQPYYILIQLQL